MMTQNTKPSLDDVLNEFVASCEKPTAEALQNLTERYPQFRRQLIDFAASWAEQLVLPVGSDLSEEQEKRLIDHAMSHVHNVAFQRDKQGDEQTDQAISSLTAEITKLGRSAQNFAKACMLDILLLTKLNSRQIKPLSIPERLIHQMARELDRSVEAIRSYLAQPPQALARKAFLAKGKPQNQEQQSFADAVRGSSLSEAERSRWLDEAARLEEH